MTKVCLIALLGMGVCATASAAEFSFGRPTRLTLERSTAVNVAVGDINGDGRADLVTTAVRPPTQELSAFLQRADGALAPPIRMAVSRDAYNNYTSPLVLADLDGNGTDEIVLGSEAEGLRIARYSPAGGFTLSSHFAGSGCRVLGRADVDGDGKVDVLCHQGTRAIVYHGNGSGGFRIDLQYHTPAEGDGASIRAADVTGDGRSDLLVTGSGMNSFAVLPSNGYFLLPPRVYAYPRTATRVWPAAMEVFDVDGDGHAEVIAAMPGRRPESALYVYRRGDDGFLALFERLPLHDSPTAMVAGDIDGDGDPELVVGHYTFHEVTVLGIGTAGLGNARRFELPGFGNHIFSAVRAGYSGSLALGDLNGDGCQDLAAATHSGFVVLRGCGADAPRVPVRDFDGDGVSDLLWLDHESGDVELWPWASLEGHLECVRENVRYGRAMCPMYTNASQSIPQAVGDFDGDGTSDVFWRHPSTGANQIWNRAYYPRPVTAVGSQDWQVAGVGDFDGDDHSDLLWRHARTGANVVWRSADSTNTYNLAPVGDLRWKVAAVGDFDGDRRSDLLWRHSGTGQNVLWSAGRSDLLLPVSSVSDLRWAVAGVGDFDADGKDDLFWRNSGTGVNSIWRSADSARPLSVSGVAGQTWQVGPVGDFDGDGRADLVWSNPDGRSTLWPSADSRQARALDPMHSPTYMRLVH